jgi:hypothetical protein
MSTQIKSFIRISDTSILRLILLSGFVAAAPVFAVAGALTQEVDHDHMSREHDAPAKLVQLVRDATQQFTHATPGPDYVPLFGCVSGPDHGAMGVHYINGDLVKDGEIDVSRPEALIYEPSGAHMRLVGVEYIVDFATWMAHHDSPPTLEGQAFQLVNSPNHYGLPAFFELHVWAWRDNPNGAFVDWNNKVTCERQ